MPLADDTGASGRDPFPNQEAGETWDAVLDGAVQFRQPATGYRVNVDSILLAGFAAAGRRASLAVDLGAGVGLVALLLHHLRAARAVALIERQADLAELARANLTSARASGEVFTTDLASGGLPEKLRQAADLVVSNPPFFDARAHRPPQHEPRRLARHGGVAPFLHAAAAALTGPKARAVLVYPASALTELLAAAALERLVPKRLRFVHPFRGRAARLALLELRAARAGGLVIEAPLIEWEKPGIPTPDAAQLTRARAADPE
ncbi:MAG TPA: methyltransferase [Polyangiaceae bacterium]|nr:methyltransferase [Polyangiaceae bacterium]